MSKIRTSILVFFSICLFFSAWVSPTTLDAEEPAAEFLEALREKEYYDIAIRYLTSLETSDLISDEFRAALPFEKAETLIKSVTRIRDINILEARLNEAESLLENYSAAGLSGSIAAKTSRYRGNLRLGRSRLYQRRSQSDRLTAQEKTVLVNKSREMLDLALKDYQQARESLKSTIANFKVDVSNPGTSTELKRLRSTYTQIRLKLPVVREQLADTYAKGSPPQIKLLEQAAEEYVYLYDTYRRFAAGLDSGLFAARCYYKIGKIDDAINQLKEIFALENTSSFKTIKRKSLVLAADCWDAQEPYPVNSVIKECEPLVTVLTDRERRHPDWQRVQMELAKAYHFRALELVKENAPGTASEVREFKKQAAKLIKTVSRSPGEHRAQAAQLMVEWNLDAKEFELEEKAPETFLEARQRGEDLVTGIQGLVNEQATIKANLARIGMESEKQKLQAELVTTQASIREQTEDALNWFDLAMSFADEKTELVDINKLRYFQSFCFFVSGQYYESALIGEFLLDRYPTVDWSRQAASLVIRSYTALHNQASKDDRIFEKEKLTEVCQALLKRWPGSSESSAAASTLTSLALEQKDWDAAATYFDDISEHSPSRAILGLKLGQRLWFAYSETKSELNEPDRNSYLAQIKKYLSQALASIDEENLTYDAALGSLLLVNTHLALGEVDAAVARLENEAIAPLDLLKQKHRSITQTSKAEVFKRGVYNTSIDTYLAAMKKSGKGADQQLWIDKTSGIISAMKGDPDSVGSLTNAYRRIAKNLKDQFDSLQSTDEKQVFAKSLASFLGSIEKDSDDANTILWAGSTLLGVANSLKDQGLESDANPLFKQAVSALSRAESMNLGDPRKVVELQRQKALAERGSGNYELAVEQFGEILKKNPSNLSIQIDAAETLHQWGMKTQQAKHFAEASSGKFKTRNKRTNKDSLVIWGWMNLVKATSNKQKYAESFNKALYYRIESLYQYGKLKPEPRSIEAARKELAKLEKRDPAMGGAKWKSKYEALKKQFN